MAPWPPTYQERLPVLRDQLDGLGRLLGPLHDAHRAFAALGGDREAAASETWRLPAGAILWIQAGFNLRVDVGEIARGVIPQPDPVICLASALCNDELWRATMVVFQEATQWAVAQAREWNVSVPGFD